MHFVELKDESGDDELKESCLQAFEALALRCFREITPYIAEVWKLKPPPGNDSLIGSFFFAQIVDVCLQMLSHDPNYNYDSDEDRDEDEAMEDDMEADEFDEKYVGHFNFSMLF